MSFECAYRSIQRRQGRAWSRVGTPVWNDRAGLGVGPQPGFLSSVVSCVFLRMNGMGR
jgi:hypothetical protein